MIEISQMPGWEVIGLAIDSAGILIGIGMTYSSNMVRNSLNQFLLSSCIKYFLVVCEDLYSHA